MRHCVYTGCNRRATSRVILKSAVTGSHYKKVLRYCHPHFVSIRDIETKDIEQQLSDEKCELVDNFGKYKLFTMQGEGIRWVFQENRV